MKTEDLKIARQNAQAIREEASRALRGLLSSKKRRAFERIEDLALDMICELEEDLEARDEVAA
jgi:hypothetical protein